MFKKLKGGINFLAISWTMLWVPGVLVREVKEDFLEEKLTVRTAFLDTGRTEDSIEFERQLVARDSPVFLLNRNGRQPDHPGLATLPIVQF